jgi:hypothetical protein
MHRMINQLIFIPNTLRCPALAGEQ